MHATLAVAGQSAFSQYLVNMLSLTLGLIGVLGLIYVSLFANGTLPDPNIGLIAIVGLQFPPLVAFVAIFSTHAWRQTNSSLPGALFAGLFVTWYIARAWQQKR
jgi:hypothetical protein